MTMNSPFVDEAMKIAASQQMSPVPKVRRGKTPLGIQKLIDSSQKPSEKLGGFRDLTILRKKKPVSAKEQLERDKADHLTRKWLDAGQSYPDPMSPPEKLAGIGVNAASRLGFENRAPGAKTRTPLRRAGAAIIRSPRAQGAAVGLAAGAYGVHKVKQMLDQHQENRQRHQEMQQHQAAMAHYQKQAAAYTKALKGIEAIRPYATSAGAGGAAGLGAHEFLRGAEPATLKDRLLWGGVGAGAGLIDRKLREDAKKRGVSKEASTDMRFNGMGGVPRPQFPTKGSLTTQRKELNQLGKAGGTPTPNNNQQAAVPRPANIIPG